MLTACDNAKIANHVRLDKKRAAVGVDTDTDGPDKTLKFGFDLRLSPKEDVKLYIPFLEYLSRTTGRRFTIVFTSSYEETVRYLGTGITQFASLGPVNCLRAKQLYQTVCLVIGKNMHQKPEYRAAIVARTDSHLKTLAELKGKSLAFGSRFSTQGYLIPRAMLEEAGITLSNLTYRNFTGSHDKTARVVLNGKYDAGAMQDTLAQQLAARGKLKIIALSRPYPASLICANAQVDPAIREAVRQALLDFQPLGKHAAQLHGWNKTEMPAGFAPYNHRAYKEIARLAKRYGLLP
jgi:phosphonate transport system substrate-binding protein